jgi:hypothetical protein
MNKLFPLVDALEFLALVDALVLAVEEDDHVVYHGTSFEACPTAACTAARAVKAARAE